MKWLESNRRNERGNVLGRVLIVVMAMFVLLIFFEIYSMQPSQPLKQHKIIPSFDIDEKIDPSMIIPESHYERTLEMSSVEKIKSIDYNKQQPWYHYLSNGEFLPNTFLITLTNFGYAEFTINLFNSLAFL